MSNESHQQITAYVRDLFLPHDDVLDRGSVVDAVQAARAGEPSTRCIASMASWSGSCVSRVVLDERARR